MWVHPLVTLLQKPRAFNIIPSIPSDCTGLLQPLDTAVYRPLKVCLLDFMGAYIGDKENRGGMLTPGQCLTNESWPHMWLQKPEEHSALIRRDWLNRLRTPALVLAAVTIEGHFMAAMAISSTLRGSGLKRLLLVTGQKTFQFPLHTTRPTESFLSW